MPSGPSEIQNSQIGAVTKTQTWLTFRAAPLPPAKPQMAAAAVTEVWLTSCLCRPRNLNLRSSRGKVGFPLSFSGV